MLNTKNTNADSQFSLPRKKENWMLKKKSSWSAALKVVSYVFPLSVCLWYAIH